MKKKAKENADELLKEKNELTEQKAKKQAEADEKLAKLNIKVKSIGNYVHESVPVSDNEDNNEIVRKWSPEGVTPEGKEKDGWIPHHGVLARLNGYDPERGTKIVGHRGYCLIGMGLFLNMALINYGLEFLYNKGYTPNQPPFFMLRDQMAKTAQLSDFDEELYKVTENKDKPETDKYLIATSEQPISALHSEEWLSDKDLPIKYAGYSTNFRKEAGSHGKDAWGIFRIHQFEKIEQFLFTKPEKSWEAFNEMIATSEEFYQSLGLSYQVVGIVSGALNNAAAKKYDLEAWFPVTGGGEYKELVSVSNCTDYQTRELEIRYGVKKATSTRVCSNPISLLLFYHPGSCIDFFNRKSTSMPSTAPSAPRSAPCAACSRTSRRPRASTCPKCCRSISPAIPSSCLSSRSGRIPMRRRRCLCGRRNKRSNEGFGICACLRRFRKS